MATYTQAQVDEAVRKALIPSRLSTYLPVASPYTTPTLVAGTPTKVLAPTSVKRQTDFTLDVGNMRWFLDTTGVTNREFVITVSSTVLASLGNNDITIAMYKNGVFEEGVGITRRVGVSNDRGAIAVTGAFSLSDNDYIEIYVTSENGGTLIFERLAINILEVN